MASNEYYLTVRAMPDDNPADIADWLDISVTELIRLNSTGNQLKPNFLKTGTLFIVPNTPVTQKFAKNRELVWQGMQTLKSKPAAIPTEPIPETIVNSRIPRRVKAKSNDANLYIIAGFGLLIALLMKP